VDPKAQELYLLGRHHTYRMNRDGLTRAVTYLREAVQIDPEFALAHAGLAEAYRWSELWAGFGLGTLSNATRTSATRALALDDSLAEAHFAMAEVLSHYDWNWPAADAAFRRAIELNPSLAEAHVGYAFHLQALNRHDEAIAAARRSRVLEPLSAYQLSQEGRILFRARQYDNALERYARALEIDPNYAPAISRTVDVYLMLGRFTEAEMYTRKLRDLGGSFEWRQMAQLYARTGRAREARAALDKVEAESVTDVDVALVFIALGDHEAAIDRLERSVRERRLQPFTLRDPRWDPIAVSPRFHAILRSVNLRP
jgi:serine/threonine-protein kinase